MLELDHQGTPATPRDAATVVLLRDGVAGLEVFLIRRHARIGFMGGAYVFPGGKLDPADADEALARHLGTMSGALAAQRLGDPDAVRALALHVAAARELFEEAGILIARLPPGADLAAMRSAFRGRTPPGKHAPPATAFLEVLQESTATLRLDALVPLSRWVTPEVEPTRFDARFFLTVLPEAQEASHDETEGTTSCWLPPSSAIDENAKGAIRLPPPTLRTLECLSAFGTVAAALADARSRRPPLVRPKLVFREGGRFALVLPGDPEHAEHEPVVPGPPCFIAREDGAWFSCGPGELPPPVDASRAPV